MRPVTPRITSALSFIKEAAISTKILCAASSRSKNDDIIELFVPRHLKSAGIMLYRPFKNLLRVRPSVCLSVCHHLVSALYLEHFLTDFFSNFA